MSTALLVILAERRRRATGHFVSTGATSPEAAISLDSVPGDLHHAVRDLQADGVVRISAAGLYYLDERGLAAHHAVRQQTSRLVLALGLGLAGLAGVLLAAST